MNGFLCTLCQKRFAHRSSVSRHFTITHSDVCGYKFTGDQRSCPDCGVNFNTVRALRVHYSRKHSKIDRFIKKTSELNLVQEDEEELEGNGSIESTNKNNYDEINIEEEAISVEKIGGNSEKENNKNKNKKRSETLRGVKRKKNKKGTPLHEQSRKKKKGKDDGGRDRSPEDEEDDFFEIVSVLETNEEVDPFNHAGLYENFLPKVNKKIRKDSLKKIKWKRWRYFIDKKLVFWKPNFENFTGDWNDFEELVENFEDFLFSELCKFAKLKEGDFYRPSNEIHPNILVKILDFINDDKFTEAKNLANEFNLEIDENDPKKSISKIRRKLRNVRRKSNKHLNQRKSTLENGRRILGKKDNESVSCPIKKEVLFEYFSSKLNERKLVNVIPSVEGRNSLNFPNSISKIDIKVALKKAKNGKCVGLDGVPYEVFKNSTLIKEIIEIIFNKCFSEKSIPKRWRFSEMFLLYKSGDEMNPDNWRPICLCNSLYKIYMTIIANWFQERKVFKLPQKGFLRYEGCTEHNFVFRRILKKQYKSKSTLMAIFIDLKNAFGSVKHNVVFHAMKKVGIPDSIIDIFRNIYSESYIELINDSEQRNIRQGIGIKQGCPMSPLLFNCVMELVSELCRKVGTGVKLARKTITHLLFADDLVLISDTVSDIRNLLCATEFLLDYIDIELGFKEAIQGTHKKTAFFGRIYSNAGWKELNVNITTINGLVIPPVHSLEEYCYLGFAINDRSLFVNKTNRTQESIIDLKLDYCLTTLDRLHLKPQEKVILYCEQACGVMAWNAPLEKLSAEWLKTRDRLARNHWKLWISRGNKWPVSSDLIHLSGSKGGVGLLSMKTLYEKTRVKFLTSLTLRVDPIIQTTALTKDEIFWCNKLLKKWGGAITMDSIREECKSVRDLKKNLDGIVNLATCGRLKTKAIYESKCIGWNDSFRANLLRRCGLKLYRFIWEARSSILSTNCHVARWKHINTRCASCGKQETVPHVVGSCEKNLGIYRKRHNMVVDAIMQHFIQNKFLSISKEVTIPSSRKRVDIWAEQHNSSIVVEVGVCWNAALEDREDKKILQYEKELAQVVRESSKKVRMFCVIVGQLAGIGSKKSMNAIKQLSLKGKNVLLSRIQMIAAHGSYFAWLARCRRWQSNMAMRFL